MYCSTTGIVFSKNCLILSSIAASSSSLLFVNLFQVFGFILVQGINVSQVIGSYILQRSLFLASSIGKSKNITL